MSASAPDRRGCGHAAAVRPRLARRLPGQLRLASGRAPARDSARLRPRARGRCKCSSRRAAPQPGHVSPYHFRLRRQGPQLREGSSLRRTQLDARAPAAGGGFPRGLARPRAARKETAGEWERGRAAEGWTGPRVPRLAPMRRVAPTWAGRGFMPCSRARVLWPPAPAQGVLPRLSDITDPVTGSDGSAGAGCGAPAVCRFTPRIGWIDRAGLVLVLVFLRPGFSV